MILIVSSDAVAAALMGALIETLGYSVKFACPPERADETMRRVRPKVCLVDCDDPWACNDETLGRAAMRRVAVVVFGTPDALDSVRALVLAHDIDTVLMPPGAVELEATLQRAISKAG